MSFHQTTVIGRLGKDPEIRYTQEGTAMATFSVAANEGFGESRKTVWYDMVAWGRLAEIIQKMCQKGTQVHIECRYQQRSWTTEEGETRYGHNFKVVEFTLLGGGKEKSQDDDDGYDADADPNDLDFPF